MSLGIARALQRRGRLRPRTAAAAALPWAPQLPTSLVGLPDKPKRAAVAAAVEEAAVLSAAASDVAVTVVVALAMVVGVAAATTESVAGVWTEEAVVEEVCVGDFENTTSSAQNARACAYAHQTCTM